MTGAALSERLADRAGPLVVKALRPGLRGRVPPPGALHRERAA